ncbi:hypothetical protein AAIH09_33825, partial [Pseudomonas aeruginosa]
MHDRRSNLLTREIDLLRRVVAQTRRRHPFRIDAWVVLPEHMHCLWTLPPDDADFATRPVDVRRPLAVAAEAVEQF